MIPKALIKNSFLLYDTNAGLNEVLPYGKEALHRVDLGALHRTPCFQLDTLIHIVLMNGVVRDAEIN